MSALQKSSKFFFSSLTDFDTSTKERTELTVMVGKSEDPRVAVRNMYCCNTKKQIFFKHTLCVHNLIIQSLKQSHNHLELIAPVGLKKKYLQKVNVILY